MALILLDAGLVGLACSLPRGRNSASEAEGVALRSWVRATAGIIHDFAIAEITHYEVRRELVRLQATAKLRRLDDLFTTMTTTPVQSRDWKQAADLWAIVRRRGQVTAADEALDGDAILAAVALGLAQDDPDVSVIVATTNQKHLAWFGVDARSWQNI